MKEKASNFTFFMPPKMMREYTFFVMVINMDNDAHSNEIKDGMRTKKLLYLALA